MLSRWSIAATAGTALVRDSQTKSINSIKNLRMTLQLKIIVLTKYILQKFIKLIKFIKFNTLLLIKY